jgi:hypothetical protein
MTNPDSPELEALKQVWRRAKDVSEAADDAKHEADRAEDLAYFAWLNADAQGTTKHIPA